MKVLAAYDKIWYFKQKSEFWRTCICHCKVDSFPIFKDFSDEIDGGSKESNLFFHMV